jgi:hypothetical protein
MKQDDTFSVGFIIDGEGGIPTADQPMQVRPSAVSPRPLRADPSPQTRPLLYAQPKLPKRRLPIPHEQAGPARQ